MVHRLSKSHSCGRKLIPLDLIVINGIKQENKQKKKGKKEEKKKEGKKKKKGKKKKSKN